MKELLKTLLDAWALKCNNEQLSIEACMETMCLGDRLKAQFLTLASHWFNDVVSVANHYGYDFIKVSAEGNKIWHDGTIDTLLKEGVYTVVEIPPSPSIDHYWYKGKWQEPHEEGLIDDSAPI